MEVAQIYNEFHRALLAFIRTKVRSKEDAEDILHGVFIKIASKINTLADEEKLKSWIYTITRNAITDYYRANTSRVETELHETLEETTGDNENEDSIKGLDGCLAGMISLLPDEYRQLIVESELEGKSQKELAVQHGIAYSSLRSRVQRGRERLKQLLQNCCHIESDRRGNILDINHGAGCGDSCNPCAE